MSLTEPRSCAETLIWFYLHPPSASVVATATITTAQSLPVYICQLSPATVNNGVSMETIQGSYLLHHHLEMKTGVLDQEIR